MTTYPGLGLVKHRGSAARPSALLSSPPPPPTAHSDADVRDEQCADALVAMLQSACGGAFAGEARWCSCGTEISLRCLDEQTFLLQCSFDTESGVRRCLFELNRLS